MSFDFVPNEQSASLLNAARRPSLQPEAGAFDNFLPGAGSYAMRSLAEVGRAVDLAGSVFPIVADRLTGGGTEQQDRYFREHDDVFNSAVDHWTPRPGEVGVAGQVAGQLVGGLAQAVISPALLVGTSQLSTAEDLVRQGVDAGAANVAGDIAGLAMAAGVRLPFLGQTAAARIASGAGGNVALGAATAGATRGVLTASGHPAQAEQFDPLDVKARTLDALLGAAFGGLAHVDARAQAALLVTNQAHHLEASTAPGRPATDADATAHVQAVRQAADQLLNGDPVSTDGIVREGAFVPDAVYSRDQADVAAEIQRLAREEAPPPLDVFHGTKADVPLEALSKTLDLGPHFTTSRATAEHFANSEGTPGHVLEGVAHFRKSLELPDLNGWFPTRVAEAWDQARGAKPGPDGQTPLQARVWAEMERVRMQFLDAQPQDYQALRSKFAGLTKDEEALKQRIGDEASDRANEAGYALLRSELRNAGYDSIKYINRNEGAPIDTYIALDMARVTGKGQPPPTAPIETPPKPGGDAATDTDPTAARARLIAERNPDLPIPTGRFAEDGTPITLRAADVIEHTDKETAAAKALIPDIFRTAAQCLLGAL